MKNHNCETVKMGWLLTNRDFEKYLISWASKIFTQGDSYSEGNHLCTLIEVIFSKQSRINSLEI